ncbi:MAG: hypothetical protein ACREMY_02355 [bacterium]
MIEFVGQAGKTTDGAAHIGGAVIGLGTPSAGKPDCVAARFSWTTAPSR